MALQITVIDQDRLPDDACACHQGLSSQGARFQRRIKRYPLYVAFSAFRASMCGSAEFDEFLLWLLLQQVDEVPAGGNGL